MAGRLEAIWIKRAHGGPMDAVERAVVTTGRGIGGNADRGGRRQLTILSLERWRQVVEALGDDVDPSIRRANLLVSGVDLEGSRDRVLRVGGVRLRIHGETRPCAQMDAARPGLQRLLQPHWGGGAYAAALDDGEIQVGDAVDWELPLFDAG